MKQEKLTIGQFSELVGLSTYTLRYYENEHLIVPKRDDNNRRFYTQDDVKWLGFLLHLKGTGMTMSEIKTYVQFRAQGDSTNRKRQKLLEEVKKRALDQIAETKRNLEVISHKIDWYDKKENAVIDEDESFENYLEKMKNNKGEA
ncbi:MerR family transcriptional regulator [Holzapfeliella floricola]|uniref:MerR regulatory family protein n=1 Tax=Holzapfeliella floricola DSM 23037 = JCM 16512 TaxID=1423744 RepID=A0A0R2DKK2_9LACO|nr:MerR family transcriptional regulator [Holzapfeliella floricola]KRN04640.1 merR regulatory family protein [Holzapfeliella floricola DSM 23037 = JCM 16512]